MASRRPDSPLTTARLGVPSRQLARGFIRLYCRFWGELRAHDLGRRTRYSRQEAEEGMRRCRDAILLLGVEFDPSSLRPRITTPKRRVLGHGEIRAGILVVLKQSSGWVRTRHIADEILCRNGVTLAGADAKHFRQKVREALHVLAERQMVKREKAFKPNHPYQRWHLVRESA